MRKGLQRGEVRCIVLAADASPRAVAKVVALAQARKVPVIPGPSADAMGAKLGKPPVMVAGVKNRELAEGMLGLAVDEVR